jgi:BirA family transcriptional regulator, biotin operon repressor / biotin---[acetyl-CoA-carboxylase] ligase
MPENDIDLARLRREPRLSQVEHYHSLASTNDRGREITAELLPGQTALILADEQTAGRGRGGNRWWTGPGSLAFSLVFDPATVGIRREHFPLISLATALAIVDSVRPIVPHGTLGLHWPNDVFACERKLAGILVEALAEGKHVLGVGLNVNNCAAAAPTELGGKTISLADLSGHEHSRTDVLLALLGQLWPNLDQLAASAAEIARRADRACLQHGRRLVIQSGDRRTEGICLGIADDGALVLHTDEAQERFYSGVLVHA